MAGNARIDWIVSCERARSEEMARRDADLGRQRLFAPEAPDPDTIDDKESEAVRRPLYTHLRRVLAERGELVTPDDVREVYGETLGWAREKDVRAVLRELYGKGLTNDPAKGELRERRSIRWTGNNR